MYTPCRVWVWHRASCYSWFSHRVSGSGLRCLRAPEGIPKSWQKRSSSVVRGLSRSLKIDLLTAQSSTTRRSAWRRDSQKTIDAHHEAYRAKRKELRNAIRDAQYKSWAELCKSVDDNPWGLPYKVVTKKIGHRRPGVEARVNEDLSRITFSRTLRQLTGRLSHN